MGYKSPSHCLSNSRIGIMTSLLNDLKFEGTPPDPSLEELQAAIPWGSLPEFSWSHWSLLLPVQHPQSALNYFVQHQQNLGQLTIFITWRRGKELALQHPPFATPLDVHQMVKAQLSTSKGWARTRKIWFVTVCGMPGSWTVMHFKS